MTAIQARVDGQACHQAAWDGGALPAGNIQTLPRSAGETGQSGTNAERRPDQPWQWQLFSQQPSPDL
jgi:hypothetical protein